MTLADAITRLQVHSLACTGVKAAPDDPPDNLGVYSYALAYPVSGVIKGESGSKMRGLHTVIVEFHVNRTILNVAVAKAKAYIEEYGQKLIDDPNLNGAVQTILFDEDNGITYEFGELAWAGTPTIGVRFHVSFKI